LGALRALARNDYDCIVAWETKNGFPIAVAKSLLRWRSPKLIVLAFGLRGLPLKFMPLTRRVMQAVDFMTVPSHAERIDYSARLGFAENRISVCPNGAYDTIVTREMKLVRRALREETDSFVFSGGYSHRDFDTVIDALRDLPFRTIIVAPRRRLGSRLPDNVKWIQALSLSEYRQLMSDARIVIVPLQNRPFAVGLVEVLNAMAEGKAIIATRTASMVDYITPHQNGILVEPNDPVDLRRAIVNLWERPDEITRLGRNARRTYLESFTFGAFARRVHALIHGVCPAGSPDISKVAA
jgi:rhamnosyl/mannosyltransferase